MLKQAGEISNKAINQNNDKINNGNGIGGGGSGAVAGGGVVGGGSSTGQPQLDIPVVNVPEYPDRSPRRGPFIKTSGPNLHQIKGQGLTAPSTADFSSSGPSQQNFCNFPFRYF